MRRYLAVFAGTMLAWAMFVAWARAQEPVDALAEVNEARARRGLPAFVKCEALTIGALNVAKFRADRLIAGHTADDFAGLPSGTSADSAGCAAWPLGTITTEGDTWGSCCWTEAWVEAGAAWALGRDGNRYTHIFVRGRAAGAVQQSAVFGQTLPARRGLFRRGR